MMQALGYLRAIVNGKIVNSEVRNSPLLKAGSMGVEKKTQSDNHWRQNYTKQGFHLNKAGKEGLARQMAKQIIDFTKTEYKDIPVIALAWKDNTGLDTPVQLTADHIMHSIEEGNDKIANICSTRQKKNPFQQEQ